ncbi:MAG: DUF456 family protein [Alkalinema sp. FL-bin-369]|nr:DUF456 family protein [Leptolyngbyaceae cyanobacterium LF-bin-369]
MTILYGVVLFLMAIGVVGAFVPGLPGTSIILAAMLIWGFSTSSIPTLAWAIGCAVAVLVFGFAIDFLSGYLGAKQVGASQWGQIGSVVGMVAGFFGLIPALPFGGPLLGLFIGPLVGAIVGEYLFCKDIQQSVKAGVGIVVGSVLGNLLQGILALVPVVVFVSETWNSGLH